MFNKILVANRGEIALRVIRACKEMGIKTVAVHSEADTDSLPVRFADESICIGAAESSDSYLNIPAVISAAEITDAEAIHPGYGFLAENSHFVEICENCQIKFIGPTSETIRMMGNKVKAKEIMKKAGVPLLPGSEGSVTDEAQAMKIAHDIGFPIIIKAAAGGGGKGMRVVHTDASFLNAFRTAQEEAMAAFGNPDVYIEKYLEEPRHIEFQIIGDNLGNIFHLGERECSIQRRYQKIIEESPSKALNNKLRAEMGAVAVAAATAIKYTTVGTIEFLLDNKRNFYFMEMNTRIQVEHPVTEFITGIDLVKEQIRTAYGEPLSNVNKNIQPRGHSIECRINAEDPEKFIPQPGKITTFNVPGGPGVRVDTAAYAGCNISPYYDSLIAKLVVHASTRIEAINKMQCALEQFIVEGIKTNIPLHQRILQNNAFIKGEISTHFLKTQMG
ncbi:MAG: acetyl-CoA carboxylase biotin carboxylase subunit [bacterium]